jgi:hypothetical protein
MGAVVIWHATVMAQMSTMFPVIRLRVGTIALRWGYIKKMAVIAAYESWKLSPDGASGSAMVMMTALRAMELMPLRTLPKSAPAS